MSEHDVILFGFITALPKGFPHERVKDPEKVGADRFCSPRPEKITRPRAQQAERLDAIIKETCDAFMPPFSFRRKNRPPRTDY